MIKTNRLGKAGLLKKIHMPAGGSIELEYGREGNTVKMPQSRYVMTKVTRNDGYEQNQQMAGQHSYSERFDYRDGYYDRKERKFYGFQWVETVRGDGSLLRQRYDTTGYYTRGLLLESGLENEDGALFRRSENYYDPKTVGPVSVREPIKFPRLTEKRVRMYEAGDDAFLETVTTYNYDEFGNIIKMEDRGLTTDASDDIVAYIEYKDRSPNNTPYLMGLPEELVVKDHHDEVVRRRAGEYDENGNLTALKRYFGASDNEYAEYTFEYDDEVGNLIAVEDPLGYRKEYSYDSHVRSYVTEIRELNSRTFGHEYSSFLSYDYRYGVETSQTDRNGHTIVKTYDSFGRLVEVGSPYDSGEVNAVRYHYYTNTFPWKAVTENKISFEADDRQTMDTCLIIDGLRRSVLTAKEGEVYREGENLYGWNRSGYKVYDSKGRAVREGQSSFEQTGDLPSVPNEPLRPTLKSYDARDRVIATTLPDGAQLHTAYRIGDEVRSKITTDPEGNVTETDRDIRGNIVRIRKRDAEGELLTRASYEYTIMGELETVTDAKGSQSRFSYDLLGRRVELESPQSGLTHYTYDKADHLIRKVDANLRAAGEAINYHYDSLGRLERIDYPRIDDTHSTYGGPEAPHNRAGRIARIEDDSGSTENFYGKLGETKRTIKTVRRLDPNGGTKSADFSYRYDYQGRMREITYPDEETITYHYNRGGQVEKITSELHGLETTYVEQIGYDEYDQRVYLRYGNGVETRYRYDEERRWLKQIETNNRLQTLQDSTYHFDAVGNITRIANSASRYTTVQEYEYDGLYQLTGAEGTFEDREYGSLTATHRYSQSFSYDQLGNLLTKESSNEVSPSGGSSGLNYRLEYDYYPDRPGCIGEQQPKAVTNLGSSTIVTDPVLTKR
jgi:YD repeat-containing protein